MNVYVRFGDFVVIEAEDTQAAHAYCDRGDSATSGAYVHTGGTVSHPSASFPIMDTSNPVGWITTFYNSDANEESLMTPMVVCLDTTP